MRKHKKSFDEAPHSKLRAIKRASLDLRSVIFGSAENDLDKKWASLKIAAIYAIFSALWILFSDQILFSLIRDPETMTIIQMIKGWIFIIISALIIFLLLRKELKKYLLAETNLQISEKKLGFLIENIPSITWIKSEHGEIKFISPNVEEILGFSQEEIYKGGPSFWVNRIHPNDQRLAKELFSMIFSSSPKFDVEYRIKKKNNEWMWLHDTSIMTFEEEGIQYAYGVFTDITEHKDKLRINEAQLELLEYAVDHLSTELIRKLLDKAESLTDSKIGFFHFIEDDQKTISLQTWSNNTLSKFCTAQGAGFHYPLDQAGVWGDCVREARSVIHNDYSALPHKKGVPEGHAPITRELVVPVFREGKIKAILGIGNKPAEYTPHDLNIVEKLADLAWETVERKRMEEALHTSEEKYRSMMESMVDQVFICSKDLCIEYANPSMVEKFGGDLIGKPCHKIIFGLDDQCSWCNHETVLKGEILTYEVNNPRDHSTYFISNSPIKNANGSISNMHILRDITEIRKMEVQLQQAQKMEAVGILTGGIAHDFNNLLQAINGYTQVLIINKSENDPDYGILKVIQDSGDRAAELVKQLMQFSRKTDAERKPVDMNKEIENVRKLLERTIPKMIDMQIHLGDRLWNVNADPVQIEQILLNLGSNAADAMPDGGKLTIETENVVMEAQNTQSRLGVRPGNYVLLTVSDTGHGMSKEIIEHIFEPFYTTKEIGKGTGLGLASVYGIVKSHEGNIICTSEVGQGTTFRIYLPAMDQPEALQKMDNHAKPPHGGAETILVVDDEKPIRDLASQFLQNYGYTVLAASSGEEALDIFSSNSNDIDLAIMDIGMPGMGGRRCLQEIRRLSPEAKVLISSGYSISGQVKKAMESGAAGYLGKPYHGTDLLDKVRTVLDEGA